MHVVAGLFVAVLGASLLAAEWVYVRPRRRGWSGPLTEGDAECG